mgnify:CR=1 FL=1
MPTYEIPYGHIQRENTGDEEPGQSWLDLSGTVRATGATYGLSLLNNGKTSYDVNVRDIGLTVLRSPIYAHHLPVQPEAGQSYRAIDQGEQRFTYSLLPHTGGWETAGTVRQAGPQRREQRRQLVVRHRRFRCTGIERLGQADIGTELFVSHNTVKGHVKAIYRKLAVNSRSQAVARGRELGLL